MKKVTLTDIQRDSLLYKALLRKVFPEPQKGQMYFSLVDISEFDADRFLYLENEYYNILYAAIIESDREGKFQSSNAYSEWKGLMNAFYYAVDVDNVDFDNLREYKSLS